jgi:tryptophan synthase alpha subunit
MEESFEDPNADETKIMKAQKYALKDRNDPSTELQHTGQ